MIAAVLIFASVAVCSGVIVAMLIRLAHGKSWYDRTSERRVHSGNVPRLGGLGFAPVFMVAAAVIMVLRENGDPLRLAPVLAGICVIVFFGVWDDFRPLRPWVKMLAQIGAALCVVVPGYVFGSFALPGGDFLSRVPWLAHAVTLLWLVGMTNAVNLLDGVDALAGGVSFMAALTFAYVFFGLSGPGLSQVAVLCVVLAGSVAGFLVFNAPVPKARIFMGDGGSQFLGFVLALLPLIKERYSDAALPVLYAAAVLAIPIFDTSAAVWRRIRDGKPLGSPDRSHVHHKLMNLGLDARKTGAALFGLQAVVSALVIASLKLAERRPDEWRQLAVLALAYVAALAFFTALHFMNRRRTAAVPETPPPPPGDQSAKTARSEK